jgi:hypothetical protein
VGVGVLRPALEAHWRLKHHDQCLRHLSGFRFVKICLKWSGFITTAGGFHIRLTIQADEPYKCSLFDNNFTAL